MKTVIKNILAFIGISTLFLACAEADTLLGQILWSGSMITICAVCAKLFEKKFMTEEELEEEV